jgi:misacylated tRNA(Ala) deacylase
VTNQGTTDEICSRDAYATEMDAVVVRAADDGVVLDRTVFYGRGGGQPGDTGRIVWDGGEAVVTETVRRDGEPFHLVGGPPPAVGTAVHGVIDWDRRHTLMRTHSALHVLSGVVWTGWGVKVTGGNIDLDGVARMDFEFDTLPADFGRDVEQRLNAAVDADALIQVSFLPRAEALADLDLIRTKVSLIPDDVDPIRVIDIVGIDKQADGGTHVRSTSEIGPIRVVKTESKGKAFKRMRIQLFS